MYITQPPTTKVYLIFFAKQILSYSDIVSNPQGVCLGDLQKFLRHLVKDVTGEILKIGELELYLATTTPGPSAFATDSDIVVRAERNTEGLRMSRMPGASKHLRECYEDSDWDAL